MSRASTLSALGFVFALVLGAPVAARGESAFTAYSAAQAEVDISHRGEDHLKFGLVAWGPNWAWTGIDGAVQSDHGAAVGALTAKMSGTGVPVHIDFRAAKVSPKQIRLEYQLRAEAATGLTLLVATLSPGKAFQGREAIVQSQGRASKVVCPFERRGLGSEVQSVRLADARGATTTLHFDPPCEIPSDGAARIVLAKDSLTAGETRRLAVTVELPDTVDWYPSAADVPDEPGIDTWYPWQAAGDTTPSAIGMEAWADQPAGKHGRVVRRGDALAYNNRPIRLWGINLCYGACAPEKALAEKRAAFYGKYGINAVRLHKFADGPGWAGIQAKQSCVEFDAEALDRMDYQVAKFKEAGIFIKLSAHFGTLKLGPGDKKYVPYVEEFGAFRGDEQRIETPHSALHYSPELQRVQILQTVNLLKHRNPYTGLTYAADPVVAFVEIINEQSIVFYTSMAPLKASATLRKQVAARFCRWLREKYGSQAKLEEAWGGRPAFDGFKGDGFDAGGESLDKDNILPLGNPWYWDPDQLKGSQAFRKRRLLDSLRFLYELEVEFYRGFGRAAREAGYEGEFIGSNWQAGRAFSHFANLHADSLVGTVDRHNYFGGDQANASMLAKAGSGMLSSGMQQVADHPFMLSEWIHVFPSEFGVEGPAILGAYGMGLQGWDVSFMFQNGDNGTFSERLGREAWDVMAPHVLGVFPVVARQVRRGDVQTSDAVAVRNVDVTSLFEGRLGFDDRVSQGYDDKELDSSKVPARSLAVARSVVAFTDRSTGTPLFDMTPYEVDGQLVSSTGQLRWKEADSRGSGWFTMDTPATKAVVGFAAGHALKCGQVTFETRSKFAAVYVTACEPDKTIESSRELLIAAIARARNTGMKFSPSGDRMLAAGRSPILMEPVKATITIRRSGSPKVFVLDHDGKMTGRELPIENGVFAIDGARDKSPYYLVRY